jgi:transcriptional regulator with XRE-family HTH domain
MESNEVVSSKSIGEKVKFRRQDIGMSQERLAEILELSYQQVQRYENGINKISVERIQEIANALTVPVMYFFEKDFSQPLPVPDTKYTPSEDEKTLLKHFNQIELNPDRQAVVLVARRLAAKR